MAELGFEPTVLAPEPLSTKGAGVGTSLLRTVLEGVHSVQEPAETSVPLLGGSHTCHRAPPQAQSLLLGERLKLLPGLTCSTPRSPQSSCTDSSVFREVWKPALRLTLADKHIT